MTETRPPLALKKPLSPETLAKLEAQKALTEKATAEKKPTATPPEPNDGKAVPNAPQKKRAKPKQPLTENELVQIQAKQEATDRAFELLHERLPDVFRRQDYRPLQVSPKRLYCHFKDDLSKALVTRALKRYFRQEGYQRAVVEGRYFYDLSGEIAGELTPAHKALAQTRLDRIAKRNKAPTNHG